MKKDDDKDEKKTVLSSDSNSITLVQPNKFTMAKYDYSACQENVLTCILNELQAHMSNKKKIDRDLWGRPMVVLSANDVAQSNNKHYVIKQLKELRKVDISFTYTRKDGKEEEVYTGLINTIRSVKESDRIEVEISLWAIPFLLYWGKGVGGTIFNKLTALTLKSIYAKRLYKICCKYKDRGGFVMNLDELREILCLEGRYSDLKDFRKRVLDRGKAELKESADLYFEYSLSKVHSRRYNTIQFKIISDDAPKDKDKPSIHYQFVYNFLTRTYPSYTSDKAMRMTEKLSENTDRLRAAYTKFCKLDDQYTSGTKTREDIIKLTKHILKSDFDIK